MDRGRGRGGRGRGRGAMNMTAPRFSANERLNRHRDPEKREGISVGVLINDSRVDQNFQRSDVGSSGCICLRPMTLVICRCCGWWTEGRVRKLCQEHPRDLYLYDLTLCLRKACKAPKNYLVEREFPKGHKSEKVNMKIKE